MQLENVIPSINYRFYLKCLICFCYIIGCYPSFIRNNSENILLKFFLNFITDPILLLFHQYVQFLIKFSKFVIYIIPKNFNNTLY